MHPSHLLRRLVPIVFAAVASIAQAQYPEKPIRLVLPFPAGSSTDAVARILAVPLSARLGQSIVIDNKPGADGSLAASEVARAPADGYTLLLATNSPMSAVPAMRKNPPYDPVTDFTPISDVGRYRYLVVVHPSLPVNSIPDLVAHAKANPGKLNFGTGNTFGKVSTFQFMKRNGIDMVEVPYKGEPPALADFVAGRLQFMFATQTTTMELVRTGKLRALATTSTVRLPQLPDVPTLKEAGIAEMPTLPWAAMFGPAKMPAGVVSRINRELVAVLGQEDVRSQLAKQAFEPAGSTPEALASLVKAQLELWKRTLPELGVNPE